MPLSEARRFPLGSYLLYCGVVAVLFLLAAEAVLRVRGFEAWRVALPDISVDPGGRFYAADPVRGYAPLPGQYTVRLPTGHRFTATHDEAGHRLTQADGGERTGLPRVWILGGSYTYGWSLDDDESFPWQLQQRLPELRIENFGVPGYGTLHGLVELRQRLSHGDVPDVVVVAYLSFHDVRNTFLRERRKRVVPYNRLGPLRQPVARLEGGSLKIAMAKVTYQEWPGMRHSALVHLAETWWNRAEDRWARSAAVTDAIVVALANEVEGAGAKLLFATLSADQRSVGLRQRVEAMGHATANLGVDLNRPGYRNWPRDAHPSPIAAREYARRLEGALRQLLGLP